MSTEQIDPHQIEQTRQQIRSLVMEIQQLAKQDLTAREFYGEFLTRVVAALAAPGGAVWTTQDGGGLELQYQICLHDTKLPENPDNFQRHGRLLHRIATTGQPALIAPHSGEGATDGEQVGNPTDFLLVLAPVKVNDRVKSVVEVFQRPGARPTTQKGYLRFLVQMCELVADYLKSHELRHFTDRQALWNQLETFTRNVHASLDPRETAYTIANEGRRLIECDRVSVAIRRGRKCYIEAVSGQDTFDKRSNTITLLSKLATAVVATGESMWYSGDTSDMAPQVEEAVQEYIDDSHSKNVAVLPLTREVKTHGDDEEERHETIGALIVEQIEHARPREGMVQRVEVVKEHSSVALANALEHNDLFLMPVWRTLGRARWVVSARTLPKTLAVVATLVALVLAMVLIPYDFKLEGKGTLEPINKRDVFASQDGTVQEIYVAHNDKVTQGQPLLKLRNTELDVAIASVRGEIATTTASLTTVSRQLHDGDRSLREDEKERLRGQEQEFLQKLQSLNEQLDLHLAKQELLTVRSPIDGAITTWNVQELLGNRPVKQGETLLSVADDSGDWEIELNMPEDRMGHIANAQRDIREDLEVEYILATNPGETHVGKVKEVRRAAEVRGEEGNVVVVKVEIDKTDLPYLRQGSVVTGKIYCGQRPIGYVWFHDLIAFIQSRILFKF